jgi:hypothetical protein
MAEGSRESTPGLLGCNSDWKPVDDILKSAKEARKESGEASDTDAGEHPPEGVGQANSQLSLASLD